MAWRQFCKGGTRIKSNNVSMSEKNIKRENVINRRQFMSSTAVMTAGLCLTPGLWATAAKNRSIINERYKIGVVDLMILKRQKLSALPLAKEIGADGLEVDMGSLGDRDTFESKLADPEVRQQYLDKARELGLEICSLSMSGFYAQSFAERPTYKQMVGDCIKTAQQMKVKVAFLPLGIKGDLVQYPELRPAIVERLQIVGKMAEEAGVIIGIETALDAKGEKKLLKDIDSPAVQSYFNFSNALKAGRDLHKELRILGKDRICMIHCTDEDRVLLQDNKRLDMLAVKETLDKMGWRGWLVIERSRDANDPHNVKRNFGSNTTYMKSVFQE